MSTEKICAKKVAARLCRRARRMVLSVLIGSFLLCALLRGQELWTLIRFGVRTVHSPCDADGDFIDDATDFMLAARRYIESGPVYDGSYFSGGYPPEGRGVCADVIWRAMEAAGYDFKAMIDADIAANPSLYPLPNGAPDPYIDFRRVVNLRVYFDRHWQSLTVDSTQIDQWQPGDVVIYDGHVAVVSDRRNAFGQPYIIHHAGYGAFEEDALTYRTVLAHYRMSYADE